MAFCIYGQPRTWSFCFPSLKKHLLDVYHPDVFLCTDGEQEQMEKAYHPTAMEAISPEEQIKIIGKRFEWYGDTLPNPGPYKDHPLKPKGDLLFLYKGWRCREMLRDYEQKHGAYDIVVSTRFDAKFLKIQPIKKPNKNTFYIPRVDAFGKSADNNGIFWGMGLCTHIWWADSPTACFMLNSYNWSDDYYKETGNWCGEAMTQYICAKMKIDVQYTDVTFMLIRGSSERPLEGLPPWLPLSEKVHPEYMAQEWEKKKTNKKAVKEPPHAKGFFW